MGQSKKRRPCPAVNREISSAECGENRLSHYACPESCPFNPFAAANYPALLQVESELDLLSVKRITGEDARFPGALLEARRLNSGHGWHAAVVWHLFFKRDGGGKTFAQRWENMRFSGLKNDERVFFRGKMQMRVALLEVHRILDDQRIEAVDLLDPAATPMIVVDRSVAARAVRFVTFLTWLYPLPHFWRMSGTGISMSDLGPFTALEMLEACIAHLGGPAGGEAQRPWLAENFVRIDEALVATGRERQRRMFSQLDATFGAATYQLQAPFAACRSALRADPEIDVDEVQPDEGQKGFVEAMVWFEAKGKKGLASATIPGRSVLGRVLLGLNEWRVEAIGGARLDQLRQRFEARLGDRVRFVKERRDDLAGRMAAEAPPVDLALVPPRLLELPGGFDLSSSRLAGPPAGMTMEAYQAELMNEQRRTWLDEPLPALDGRTAREAARLPAWRGRVLELVKAQVRQVDQRNLELDRSDDVNAHIRELGLAELDFPPPPRRACPVPEAESEADFENDEDDDSDDFLELPQRDPKREVRGWSAPPFVSRPLTLEEALERMQAGIRAFATASEALDEIDASGSTLLDDAYALAEGEMDERDFGHLNVFLIQAWFALVPRAAAPPPLRFEAMAAMLERDAKNLGNGGVGTAAKLRRITLDSPQPHLMEVIVGAVVASLEKGPKATRPRPGSIVGIVLVLKAVIAEIDQGLRGQ